MRRNKGYDDYKDYKGSEDDYVKGKKAITLMFEQLNKKLDKLIKLAEELVELARLR